MGSFAYANSIDNVLLSIFYMFGDNPNLISFIISFIPWFFLYASHQVSPYLTYTTNKLAIWWVFETFAYAVFGFLVFIGVFWASGDMNSASSVGMAVFLLPTIADAIGKLLLWNAYGGNTYKPEKIPTTKPEPRI